MQQSEPPAKSARKHRAGWTSRGVCGEKEKEEPGESTKASVGVWVSQSQEAESEAGKIARLHRGMLQVMSNLLHRMEQHGVWWRRREGADIERRMWEGGRVQVAQECWGWRGARGRAAN
ncbi:unnamed protein product [Calypogeia fissa]